jgi:hypothetical protein
VAGPWTYLGDDRLVAERIRDYDRQLETICQERYPQTDLLRQVEDVGVRDHRSALRTLQRGPERALRVVVWSWQHISSLYATIGPYSPFYFNKLPIVGRMSGNLLQSFYVLNMNITPEELYNSFIL